MKNIISRIVDLIIRRINFHRDFRTDIKLYNKKCMEGGATEFIIDRKRYFLIYEKEESAAVVDGHYFLMDYYFSKLIKENNPIIHYDIGSRVDGFITHLLVAGIKVTMFDIRPFFINLDGLGFVQADAMKLNEIDDNSIDSISSLHAIEHFGLGRYGDEIDPNGWKKALKTIQKKVKVGGYFYLGLPIADNNYLYFNAHRLFDPITIINELDEMELVSFAYIHDFEIKTVKDYMIDFSKEINEGDCGLFWFQKK